MNNADNKTAGKLPAYIAYQVLEGEGRNFWTKIGAAWPHAKDGKGFTIQLDALPLDGRIVLRVASEKKD
jgi:hypothetical protein